MKKAKFAVSVLILALAFPVLFIVGITHAMDTAPEKTDSHEFHAVKTVVPAGEYVYSNSHITCPILLN